EPLHLYITVNTMDGIGMNLLAAGNSSTSPSAGSLQDNLPFLAAALLIWYVESSLRARNEAGRADSGPVPSVSCVPLVRRFAPETLGLLACLGLAAVLRAQGDRPPADPADRAAWEEIQRQWPILSTADSLFALQAMLRLVLVLSAVLRPSGSRGTVDASPMTGSTALFYLLAGIIRVTLLIVSPDHGLEGPLSGPVYLAFE
ncbi:unnamed protein product, partial [Polarella glacialis]